MAKLEFILPKKKDDILFGFEYHAEGGLICTNQKMLDKQKGVLTNVAK